MGGVERRRHAANGGGKKPSLLDGWEDAEVHNNPKEVREKALKMGANILNYIFNN